MKQAKFIKNHLPDSQEDITTMCTAIGVDSVDTLINETIPSSIRKQTPLAINAFESDYTFLQHITSLAKKK